MKSMFEPFVKLQDAWGYSTSTKYEEKTHTPDLTFLQQATDVLFRFLAGIQSGYVDIYNLINKYIMYRSFHIDKDRMDMAKRLMKDYFKEIDLSLYQELISLNLKPANLQTIKQIKVHVQQLDKNAKNKDEITSTFFDLINDQSNLWTAHCIVNIAKYLKHLDTLDEISDIQEFVMERAKTIDLLESYIE